MLPGSGMGMLRGGATVFFLIIVVTNGIECARYRNKGHGTNTSYDLQHMRTLIEKESKFMNKGKICIGTNGRMSVPSNRDHHYRNLRDRYINCTYVDGNLELTWLQDENLDLSFLQYIREVTGYVLISHVDIKRIVLPRLQIIRGRTLFKMNVREEEFALIVTLSKMYTLELPALRDILQGNVGLFNNYNLCHIKTINWKEIISDPVGKKIYVYNFTSPERECTPCHKDCKQGCWGSGRENCQNFSKETCSPQCFQGRCFGPNPRECCHLFCAGGCTGPKQSDCIACRNFYDDGVCKQECPPMQIYNPTTYSWEVNPEGKYAYGATCVKKCPEHLLKDNGACVRSCPPNKRAVDSECVPCDGPCPKTCIGVGTVHSGNIEKFKGCTVVEGNIEILENSFIGFTQFYDNFSFGERYSQMHPDALEVFSTLKEITGYLSIQAYHNDFKNLSYFRNLEVIGGRTLFEFSALYIVKTSLESLEMRSLKKINMGAVTIVENKHLCFAESISWNKIKRSHEHVLMLSNNSDAKSCKSKKLVCDEQCSRDGCWGPGADDCLSCLYYKFGNQCLQNCSVLPGIYRSESNECKPCHEQCGLSCYGPGAGNCTTCKYYKDGPFCVSQCPTNKYEEDGTCKQCHSACVSGCTGPKNSLGPGGCNSCELGIMGANATVDVCLNSNDSCPYGYFIEFVNQNQAEVLLRSTNGKGICRKCHPRCKSCTGFGFHVEICPECTNYRKGEQCEDECPPDYYPDESTNECIKCDGECRGCRGLGPENCNACQNFKVFTDGNVNANNTLFRCVATCPVEYPHRVFPEDGGSYCSDVMSSSLLSAPKATHDLAIIIVISIIVVITVMLIVWVIYYCRKKEKMTEDAMKMTRALTGLEDNEPLRPSNVLPNIAKLRIIKETEIRKGSTLGYGAFGTVYKGVWVLEGENAAKIPVAIKVLREDTGANSSKDFLDEAYIMATVDHPNLLQLLAVCMTSQMMLITQLMPLGCLLDFVRNNREKIGSKTLLNWSTQIARGMAYLEEKRLVHRDLAARNVLVQTPACVKITDFGLAKLLDINEEEYKAAGGKMPIKWLALECIQHRIFTHKSDVWAFGVTVWELLTFGGRPYDNVPARDVPELLEKGERLPQPAIASIEVYMIMIKCWMLDAESRPCFKELEDDFSKMARDPGRYLAIPGDRFMRLTNFSVPQSDRDMVKSLASALETSEGTSDGDEYLQPKSRAPLSATGLTSISSMSPSPTPDKYWPSAQAMASDGSTSQYQNHLNQKLLRYAQSHSFDPSLHTTQSDGSSMRSMKMRDDIGSDEYDSGRSQAQVGTLKLELPVDEDDYLMPSPQQAQGNSTYVDLIDSKNSEGSNGNIFRSYSDFYKNNIDNPEYLMNNDTPSQTVGLPTVSEYVHAHTNGGGNSGFKPSQPYLPQRSSEEESDHEYYNDFDRLQRELQPLKKNNAEAIV